MGEGQHLDMEALAELKEVMEEDYSLLLTTFLADAEERMTALVETVQAADAEGIRQVAHSFKGSSGNIGATGLAALCREAEDKGREGQLDGCDELATKIQEEYVIVKSLIDKELEEL